MDTNFKLASKQIDEATDKYDIGKDPPTDQETYQRLIRKSLYLTVTRPDISLSVQTLS